LWRTKGDGRGLTGLAAVDLFEENDASGERMTV